MSILTASGSMRRGLIGCVIVLSLLFAPLTAIPVQAQHDGLQQINDEVHDFLHKQRTLGRLPGAFLVHQPLSAYEAGRYLDSLALRMDELSLSDQDRLARLRNVAPEPGAEWISGRLGFLYENGQDFAAVEGDDYALQANPLYYGTLGRATQTEAAGRPNSVTTWRNTRGIRLSGHIGPYIFFESRLEENQERPLRPEANFSSPEGTAPRLGEVRLNDGEVYDYWDATGTLGVRTSHFEVRFGRERNRWGYGPSSLFLSNFPAVYDQIQIRTTVWRLQYTNLFTRYVDASTTRPNGSEVRPRRYGALHSLLLNVTDNFQINLFENVVFAADTSFARRSDFDLAYLNPVIFYRAVEADLGSPDNVLLGGGFSWVVTPGIRLYSQFLLDELRVSEIGNQWWANKWGWLAGFQAAGFGIPDLTARFEFARQRPYLYSHRTNATAFIHYLDNIGHPAGPNSYDYALFLDYRPTGRIRAAANVAYTLRGRNGTRANGEFGNFGSDPTLSYETRVRSRNVSMLQGIRQDQLLLEAHVGYELLPQLYAEVALRSEIIDDEEFGTERYVIPFLSLRWGLPFESLRY